MANLLNITEGISGLFTNLNLVFARIIHTHNFSDITDTKIIDNLTTNNSTDVLSAKQGKILNDRLTNIELSNGQYSIFLLGEGDFIAWFHLLGNVKFIDYKWTDGFTSLNISINGEVYDLFEKPEITTADGDYVVLDYIRTGDNDSVTILFERL